MARRSNNKGGSKLVRSARRNVRIQTAPQRNAVDRAELQSGQDYTRALQAAQSAYGGFQDELQDQPQFPLNRLTNQLQGQLDTFHSMLQGAPQVPPEGVPTGPGMPTGLAQPEQTAGTALYSQLGDNAFNTLTNTASRDEMYSRSAGREGSLAERYAKENLIQDMQDQLQGFEQRRMEISDLQGPMIQQEMERLRQEHQDDASNRALMQYLMGSIRGDLGGGGGPGGEGGGGHRRITNPVGPGGGTGGYGLGDTSAGGNQVPPGGGIGAVGATQGGGGYPTQGTGSIPASWASADEWNDLPPVLTHAYTRPYGVTLQESFQQTPHPSFTNFAEFQQAWEAYKRRLNELYNAYGGPGYDAGHRGPR